MIEEHHISLTLIEWDGKLRNVTFLGRHAV